LAAVRRLAPGTEDAVKTAKAFALALALALVLAAPSGLAAQAAGDGGAGAQDAPPANQTAPALTMAAAPDDPPETARFKAALRLLAGFHLVLAISKACDRQDVWENYQNRNGRTFSQVYGSLKSGGAFDQNYRNLVEGHVQSAAQDALKVGCEASMRDVENGGWDLYKANRFRSDYRLFVGR
jgi:hypothetical protein